MYIAVCIMHKCLTRKDFKMNLGNVLYIQVKKIFCNILGAHICLHLMAELKELGHYLHQ